MIPVRRETKRIPTFAFAGLMLLAHATFAQVSTPSSGTPAPAGSWRGTSTCLVRPSACHDEIVVYRITPVAAADSFSVDARKIVGGAEEEMGVLACGFATQSGVLTCRIPSGTWLFRAGGDSLVGELRLRDNTKFRDVRAARAP